MEVEDYFNSPDFIQWLEISKKQYDYSQIIPLSYDFLFFKNLVDKNQKTD